MKRSIVIFLCLLLCSCSTVMTTPSTDSSKCTDNYTWPAIDTFLIMGGAFAAGPIGIGVFAASATYGYINVARCEK